MDRYFSIKCRWCHAPIGEPCRGWARGPGRPGRGVGRKVPKFMHTPRVRDIYKNELERRRKIREAYLARWLLQFGSIFEE